MICVNFDQHIAFYWTENNMVRIFYICNRKRNQIKQKSLSRIFLKGKRLFFQFRCNDTTQNGFVLMEWDTNR